MIISKSKLTSLKAAAICFATLASSLSASEGNAHQLSFGGLLMETDIVFIGKVVGAELREYSQGGYDMRPMKLKIDVEVAYCKLSVECDKSPLDSSIKMAVPQLVNQHPVGSKIIGFTRRINGETKESIGGRSLFTISSEVDHKLPPGDFESGTHFHKIQEFLIKYHLDEATRTKVVRIHKVLGFKDNQPLILDEEVVSLEKLIDYLLGNSWARYELQSGLSPAKQIPLID